MKSSFDPQVLVVEASAGSGKTYALAKRYVQLSLQLATTRPLAIQSILAITFTNKATLTMKSRILDLLKRIALEQLHPFEVADMLTPLGLSAPQAAKIAGGLMRNLIRQYHYFQVQTIDSFVNILLVGCAFKMGLSARFKIKRNAQEYLALSLDILLDEAGRDAKTFKLFEDFVRQYLFLENRLGWFPKEDLLKIMGELFKQHNTYHKPFLAYPLVEDIFVLKKKIMRQMQALQEMCPLHTKKLFLDHLQSLLDKETFDTDALKSYWAKEELPINKGELASAQLCDLWNQLRVAIEELCFAESYSMFNPYVALFERVARVFGHLSKRDDILFLEELNRKAAMLFEDGLMSVEELYFRLATRFEHYLMDEFQDTSLAQWQNLALLVHEALSTGGSLFYVGDKKQAIYAFRGGESGLFDALQTQLTQFSMQRISLDKNYRSCPAILAFNNRVFSKDNLEAFMGRRLSDALKSKRDEVHFTKTDLEALGHVFGSSAQVLGKDLTGGLVRVTYLHQRLKEERALEARGHLIVLIKDLCQRFALKDIAILTRGNQEVEEITRWLLEEGIYASSERSSDIKNNPLIAELIALLHFLYRPLNNNAFMQFCLGELLPKATGILPSVFQDFLFECARLGRMKDVYVYQRFKETFPSVWEDFFKDFVQRAGIYPLYALTAGIMDRLGCEKHFPRYQGFLMHFLELIKKWEKENDQGVSFLTYYENLEGEARFVPMLQVNALKVLTVHKAKGLEFPVVIIPYLEMDIKAGSGGRDGSQAYMLDIQEEGMHLIRLKEQYRKFCPNLQIKYEAEYKKSFMAELNTLYVALTRAIEELHVFVPSRSGITVNPALFLIPEDCVSIGTAQAHFIKDGLENRYENIKPFIADPWVGLYEDSLNRSLVSARLAQRGEFYHAVLMQIGHLCEDTLMTIVQKAWDQASRQYPLSISQETQITTLLDFLNRSDVRGFFFLPIDVQIFCEKTFVNAYGDTKRMDRLIIGSEAIWIVDYKLSSQQAQEHQKQMAEYCGLIKSFYPKHKITGHILYLKEAMDSAI